MVSLFFFHNVQKGSLHGIINPLFEEHLEISDLVELDFDDDALSNYYEKLDFFSSSYDNDCERDVAFNDEGCDQVVVEDQLTCNKKFYDDSYEVKFCKIVKMNFKVNDTMSKPKF